ncbi:MAG: HAMP domain-containing histidine kinase [Candidatus Omnitrophota bacterium]|nr:MAG: HAMP domain-containing histidine kinase [Candidatus Omnitrophota bacterium]
MNIIKSLISMDPLIGTVALLLLGIFFLAIYTLTKVKTIAILKKSINYLNQTIQELDHEAKLIIKSDVELKLYQEESEDKLNKLTLLKNLILSSLRILDKEQLFAQINEKIINDLGFKRGAIINLNDQEVKLNIGFQEQEMKLIQRAFLAKRNILQTTPLLSAELETYKELSSSLHLQDFLIAPVKARENVYAIFIVTGLLIPREIKRAEKEIFAIICMYLGQCLDNIDLFEELYRAKDDLEKKVKERTNELVKSLREIETISKLKSDFISSVSHELRTPLTSVKGFSSLLVEEKFGKLPPQAKDRLETIDKNVNKLVDMVNILLDISRIESGKIEVKISPSDITKLIKSVVDFLSPQIQSRQLKLALDVPGSLAVYMDKDLIERVLINLINNAIKFTPPGGMITVGCKKETRNALISISDTGCGIEKNDLEKVFQEFFRVDNPVNRQLQGSGLGLSLVKRIIDTHKEKIWVESEAGKGTTFRFTLKLSENV